MSVPAIGFTGSPLDRADRLRHDADALAAAEGDWRARLLKLTGLDPEMDQQGRLVWTSLADAAEEAKAASKDVRTMIGQLQGPTSEFATTGLPQVTAAVIQLQSAAESLERLVNDIQSNPTGALSKAKAEEVKVPQ